MTSAERRTSVCFCILFYDPLRGSGAVSKAQGSNKDKVFHRGAEGNIQSVIDVLGDRPVDEYASPDAASYRDYLLQKGLTTNSVKRNFSTIRSIINLCIQEHGLDCKNAFSRVYLPDLDDSKKRKPIPIENIRQSSKTAEKKMTRLGGWSL